MFSCFSLEDMSSAMSYPFGGRRSFAWHMGHVTGAAWWLPSGWSPSRTEPGCRCSGGNLRTAMEDCAVNWAQSSTRAPIGWDVHALLSREHLKPDRKSVV